MGRLGFVEYLHLDLETRFVNQLMGVLADKFGVFIYERPMVFFWLVQINNNNMTMPEPVGKQKEVVCLSVRGHHVVLGSAGSGKTTMAVARALYLSNPDLPGNGKTLLITFNKTLMRYIRGVADLPEDRVDVRNYHHFARGYLSARGKMTKTAIISPAQRTALISEAVEEVKSQYEESAFFHRKPKFFSDEIKWISGSNIASADQYLEVRRVGRAAANLSRALRPIMWEICKHYRTLRAGKGRLYDLDDIAAAVSASFDSDTTPRLYKHIIIDEGQDLSPEMIRSLAKAVVADGSITFFGDVAQQIYGRGMGWRDAGLHPSQIWQFQQNYRNTISIAKLGLAISAMPYYAGEPDMVAPIFPTADGPKPALVEFSSIEDEIKTATSLANTRSTTRSVAILLRTHAQIKRIQAYLSDKAIPLKEDSANWATGPGLYFGTYHSAKGLEFDVVILPFLSDGEFPSAEDIETDGEEESFAQDGRLLYVGVTRAKTELVITYTGIASKLLPLDATLYTKAKR